MQQNNEIKMVKQLMHKTQTNKGWGDEKWSNKLFSNSGLNVIGFKIKSLDSWSGDVSISESPRQNEFFYISYYCAG